MIMIDYDDARCSCRAGGWMEGYGVARRYTPYYLAEFMVKCRRARWSRCLFVAVVAVLALWLAASGNP